MSQATAYSLDARERLIVALDVASVPDAEALIVRLGDTVSFYKIGYRLGFAGGLDLARRLIDAGKQVFLDFKLHDIANTVADGTASLAAIGATYLTVHAYPQTMKAALEGREGTGLQILAVTVLTSYDDEDLKEAGFAYGVSELVRRRAEQAREIGVDGLICSPQEVKSLRGVVGGRLALVTPGVRPAGSAKGDQKRIMTPRDAISAGADRLVVGRPVIAADDPQKAAAAIVAEIEEGAA